MLNNRLSKSYSPSKKKLQQAPKQLAWKRPPKPARQTDSPGIAASFRPVNPKCARLQRLRRAAGCFGEKGPTPNPGRGLRFPAR